VTLSDAQYIYKEPNDKSQKTWMFKKGTLVTIVGVDGDWVQVRDASGRKGFVKKDVLSDKQQ
jgi:SH3-like domain-containing protein